MRSVDDPSYACTFFVEFATKQILDALLSKRRFAERYYIVAKPRSVIAIYESITRERVEIAQLWCFFYKERTDGNDRRKNRNETLTISRDLYR